MDGIIDYDSSSCDEDKEVKIGDKKKEIGEVELKIAKVDKSTAMAVAWERMKKNRKNLFLRKDDNELNEE